MVTRPRDLASRMAARRKPDDGYLRETFTLPRDVARTRARDFLDRYPKAAYMSAVDSWRETTRRRYRIHDAAARQRGLSLRGGRRAGRLFGNRAALPGKALRRASGIWSLGGAGLFPE